MHPKDADGLINSANPDRSSLIWVYTVSPDLSKYLGLKQKIVCSDRIMCQKNIGRVETIFFRIFLVCSGNVERKAVAIQLDPVK